MAMSPSSCATPSLPITAGLEAEALAIVLPETIAWNRRGTEICAKPVALVDETLARLGWSGAKLAAIERQRLRSIKADIPGAFARCPPQSLPYRRPVGVGWLPLT